MQDRTCAQATKVNPGVVQDHNTKPCTPWARHIHTGRVLLKSWVHVSSHFHSHTVEVWCNSAYALHYALRGHNRLHNKTCSTGTPRHCSHKATARFRKCCLNGTGGRHLGPCTTQQTAYTTTASQDARLGAVVTEDTPPQQTCCEFLTCGLGTKQDSKECMQLNGSDIHCLGRCPHTAAAMSRLKLVPPGCDDNRDTK